MSQIVAIIQARLTSTRLPGKVLRDIAGKPMLDWVVERTHRSKLIDQVVVATTLDPADDKLFDFCENRGYLVKRGDVHDVLDRYYRIAKELHATIIVRITADCPFIDPLLIDRAVGFLRGNQKVTNFKGISPDGTFDFVANRLPPPWGRSYPIGLDIETFYFERLVEAWQKAVERYQREHVTPYFYEDASVDELRFSEANIPLAQTITPKGYKILLMHHSSDCGQLRWTVDTHEDLEVARLIADHFDRMDFTWQEIYSFVQKNPKLSQLNAHILHKTHLDVDQRNK